MGSTDPVVVVAHWQTTETELGTVLAHVAALRPQALAEPGCLGYQAFQSVDDPTHLLLVEHYRDAAALDEHLASRHYQELAVERVRPLLTDRQVELLQPRKAT
ncbi:antibiotic biosynthesis monooxygenase [Mycolicibacterium fluoranthenivorans]|uniref:Antibiotic biosynthesis monooxygenase n=1 Tax=Mycolicibacterium fluoranthenivorans TaxID=258505 RepID=A0A7G8PFU9_9MYCO|nr:putative quinol monooxygenase [Mycolicibacterium fluoranthenivorans]QNJ93215.1 antibiotic biosynthesis monooxygenase [Mycolicibacterium fluoranthenivorans]